MKTLEDYFADWENDTFGYGYGTGEEHTIAALHDLFMAFKFTPAGTLGFDAVDLEAQCGPVVAWLLINILCHDDKIEYGTSPRHAWVTPPGNELARFIRERTIADLLRIVDRDPSQYVYCMPDHCNCLDVQGTVNDCTRRNPFWSKPR